MLMFKCKVPPLSTTEYKAAPKADINLRWDLVKTIVDVVKE